MERAVPNSPLRRVFGALLVIAAGAMLIALTARVAQGRPYARWTDFAFSAGCAVLALQYFVFPESWKFSFPLSRWIPIAIFLALSASHLSDALKG